MLHGETRALINIDLQGRAKPVLQESNPYAGWAIPSQRAETGFPRQRIPEDEGTVVSWTPAFERRFADRGGADWRLRNSMKQIMKVSAQRIRRGSTQLAWVNKLFPCAPRFFRNGLGRQLSGSGAINGEGAGAPDHDRQAEG
jgi:hypothetical protein